MEDLSIIEEHHNSLRTKAEGSTHDEGDKREEHTLARSHEKEKGKNLESDQKFIAPSGS